jgi:hypothetical protein
LNGVASILDLLSVAFVSEVDVSLPSETLLTSSSSVVVVTVPVPSVSAPEAVASSTLFA